MKRVNITLLAVLTSSLVLVACAGKSTTPAEPAPESATTGSPAARPALNWKRFQDPAGRFAIELPGEPTERTSAHKVTYGQAKEQSFLIDLKGTTVGIAITVFPPEFMKEALEGQILAAARKQVSTEVDGTVTEDRPSGFPSPDGGAALGGRQVVVESESMHMVSRNRWVMHGGTLYRILQSGSSDATPAADFERLVSSFQLLAVSPSPAP